MKLYNVAITFNILVLADNESGARNEAKQHAKDEIQIAMDTHTAYFDVDTVDTIEEVPEGWTGAVPYGGSDERTVGQILEVNQ